MVTRTRLIITLYLHCLSCSVFICTYFLCLLGVV